MGLLSILSRVRSDAPRLIVSGLPRSGTSLMMQMLAAGGVPILTDYVRQPDASNPKGYYELEAVKRLDTGEADWLAGAAGQAVKVVSPLLHSLPHRYRYHLIFMERPIAEVVRSQARMLAQAGETIDPDQAAHDYTRHVAEVKRWLADQTHITTCYILHRAAIYQPGPTTRRVAQFIQAGMTDMRLDADAMARVIDPALYRAGS